ncbi:MAG TPA: PASTA domain-containing protein [Candidatus Binatia bacterium]|nr:PASTA domain-containing protein [Candidatus Binatia bacterium]
MRWKVALLSTAWLGLLVLVPALAQVRTAVDLPATGEWVDTGVDVRKGDSLGVTVNARRARARSKPQAMYSPGAGTPGGETLQSAPPQSAPPQSAPPPTPPTLTGKIGEVTFAVSAKCVAPATGRLFLRMASAGVSGSAAGMVRVSISHVPRALPTTSAPVKTVLPNVVGMRFAAAARSLKKFKLVARRRNVSSSRPAGEVLEQSPGPGVDIDAVKGVVLTVSGGTPAETNTAPPQPRTAPPAGIVATPAPPGRGVLLPPRTRTTPTAGYVTPRPRPTATSPGPPASVAQTSAAPVRTPRPIRTSPAPRYSSTAAPVSTAAAASAKPATPQPATPQPASAPPRTAAPPSTTAPASPPATSPPPPPTAAAVTVAVPSVVGLAQENAVSTVARSKLRAVYRGEEPSRFAHGLVTRTDPAAGARLTPGALVGYWLSSGENVSVGAPSNGWIVWLVAAGLLVIGVLVGLAINARLRLARTTTHLLTIRPSLELDGPVSFAGEVPPAGPATHLRASLEDGEASFEEPGVAIERKEQNGGG